MLQKGGGHLLGMYRYRLRRAYESQRKTRPHGGRKGIRLWIQIIFAALTNGYVNGFLQSKIYTGPTKAICVPGLNCYSCPGALGVLPHRFPSGRHRQPELSVLLLRHRHPGGGGRVLWAVRFAGSSVPSGWYRTCFHKIPKPKLKKLPGEKYLKYLKYVVLTVFVLMLPMFATSSARRSLVL